MSERPFMQLYVSQFLGDTNMLNCEQSGSYLLLLLTMWNAGGSLPDDDTKLARASRLSLKKWRAIRPEIMAYMNVEGGVITNRRLTEELQKVVARSELRASAGAKGGEAKSLKNKNAAVASANNLPAGLPEDTGARLEKIEDREEPYGSSKRTPKELTPREWLETVLRPEIADAVLKHRQARRAPLTSRAAKLLAGQFSQCADPNMAADLMVVNGWQGFKPEWVENHNSSRRTQARKSTGDALRELGELFDGHNGIQIESGHSGDPLRQLPRPGE
ncbi:YdaU family protein [Mesorhizobium sp. Cs1299R1N3]|uniref:YdaU family protein n=1 Tax=Mesorhizobium sp. Cs1299R1N3 TaxID=3015173 RepID=UPI00301BDA71